MISDSDALLIMGEILAGFLKENLPAANRWKNYVIPALRGQPDLRERPLEHLDISGLLQVFIGNKSVFFDAGVFRTSLPVQLALCVRNIRNARAHQSNASIITDDEFLFDLHVLRRFAMLADNRAVKPGLVEQFLSSLDERIVATTVRCLGSDPEQLRDGHEDRSSDRNRELAELLAVSAKTRSDLLFLDEQLRETTRRLAEVSLPSTRFDEAQSSLAPRQLEHRLENIDWKLDQLLARGAVEPESVDVGSPSGEPEKFSYLEAKAALRALRGRLADEFPDVEPVHQLLRQSMIDLILDRRIDNLDLFQKEIPDVMRRDTDSRQLKSLPQIFDVVKRLR